MAEIYGTTTLENKWKIRSVGDVIATVRGRRCVVSAMGFENKVIDDDVRLLAKDVEHDAAAPGTLKASDHVQAMIDVVSWPDWPQADAAVAH